MENDVVTAGPCNMTDTSQYFADPRIARLAANGILPTECGKFYVLQIDCTVLGQTFAEMFAPVEMDIDFGIYTFNVEQAVIPVKLFNATGAAGTCFRYAVNMLDEVVKNRTQS